jgi:hypothetical protein
MRNCALTSSYVGKTEKHLYQFIKIRLGVALLKNIREDQDRGYSSVMYLQQLQLYVPAGTRILGDKYHLSPVPVSVHYTLLQSLDINLITNFTCPPFTVTSIWVELSCPAYFEIAVPNDPRWSSPPDAEVEVAVSL